MKKIEVGFLDNGAVAVIYTLGPSTVSVGYVSARVAFAAITAVEGAMCMSGNGWQTLALSLRPEGAE